MKIKLLAVLEPYVKDYSDEEKVLLSVVTFLHQKYPTTKHFQLYARDVKVILNHKMFFANALNIEIPGLQIGAPFFSNWILAIKNAEILIEETIEVTITKPQCIAKMTHLKQLMIQEQNWEEHDFRPQEKYLPYKVARFTPQEIEELFNF